MNKKQLQLVSYEQAKRLKELGFDYGAKDVFISTGELYTDTFANHNFSKTYIGINFIKTLCIDAPTISLALKFMRDVKKMEGYVMRIYNKKFMSIINSPHHQKDMPLPEEYLYDTYEDAESVLLDELLTIFEK